MKNFRYSYLAAMQVLAFLLSFGAFFGILGFEFEILHYAGMPLAITGIAFLVIYILMCRVYGSMQISVKKSKPILYAYLVNLFVTDLVTHLFLCILNSTIHNHGQFIYQGAGLLLIVYLVQMLCMAVLAYGGNGLYFRMTPPQRCLVVKRPQDNADPMIRKVSRFKRQYEIIGVCDRTDPDLFNAIDKADAVFMFNLAVTERSTLIEYCYQKSKEVYHSVEISDIVATGSERTIFDDMSIIHYRVKGLTPEQRFLKRLMDILVSAMGLLLTSPILLITAIAVKLEDRGPVFYKQPRVTLDGDIFHVLKFRSMRVEDGNIHRSATKNDDRITKVGRTIRKFRIDELPQLINILRGDMSLVGPRPEMVENVRKYTRDLPQFAYRHRVKAGLTGMAQIYGKYNTSPVDKLVLDLFYIEEYSLMLDIKLILRTVLVLLTPEESTEEFEPAETDVSREEQTL